MKWADCAGLRSIQWLSREAKTGLSQLRQTSGVGVWAEAGRTRLRPQAASRSSEQSARSGAHMKTMLLEGAVELCGIHGHLGLKLGEDSGVSGTHVRGLRGLGKVGQLGRGGFELKRKVLPVIL